MKAKTLILPAILWLMCALSSCNREKPTELQPSSSEEEEPSYDGPTFRELNPITIDSLFFDTPCTFSENLPEEIKDVFLQANPKGTVANNLPVAIISSSEIGSELARQTLESNGIVFIYRPRNEDLDHALDSISHPLVGQNLSGVLILGLKADGNSLQLLDFGRALEYSHILELVRWTNGTSNDESTYSEIMNFSHVTQPFPFVLKDKEICHVMWSKPDYLSGKGDVSLILDVCPIHKIGDQTGDAADYYIAKCTVSVHSKEMYDKYTKKHGGVKARICGFYLKRFKFSMELLDQNGNNKGTFCVVPVPATFVGSTSYTNSISWNLGGQISASVANASVSSGVTFNNSVANNIYDVDLYNQHNGGVMAYQVNIGNLPHYKAVPMSITDPPSVANNTLDIHCNWIWRVPQGDNTTDAYSAKFLISDMVYGACAFYSSEEDFRNREFEIPEMGMMIALPVPSREATGTVSIKKGLNYPDSIALIHNNGRKYTRKTDDRDVYDFIVLEGDYTVKYFYKGSTYTYDKTVTVPRCGSVTLDMGYGFK